VSLPNDPDIGARVTVGHGQINVWINCGSSRELVDPTMVMVTVETPPAKADVDKLALLKNSGKAMSDALLGYYSDLAAPQVPRCDLDDEDDVDDEEDDDVKPSNYDEVMRSCQTVRKVVDGEYNAAVELALLTEQLRNKRMYRSSHLAPGMIWIWTDAAQRIANRAIHAWCQGRLRNDCTDHPLLQAFLHHNRGKFSVAEDGIRGPLTALAWRAAAQLSGCKGKVMAACVSDREHSGVVAVSADAFYQLLLAAGLPRPSDVPNPSPAIPKFCQTW
jgi:hypothetical protein